MRRRRGILIGSAATIVIVASAIVTPSLSRMILHRPDPAAALTKTLSELERTAADNNGPGSSPMATDDVQWATSHRDDIALEIASACRWLSARTDPGEIDHSGASTTSALAFAYAAQSELPLSEAGRMFVTYAAWEHACWWDRHDRTAPASPQDR